jgi:metal-sulfur cluster biosynthetic enzyme
MNTTTENDSPRDKALEALKNVFDPEIGINIVDLGLIYDIEFLEDDKQIQLQMTLTTEFCPMGEAIVDDTTSALSEAFPGFFVNVDLTFDPPWSYELLSDEGRKLLGR